MRIKKSGTLSQNEMNSALVGSNGEISNRFLVEDLENIEKFGMVIFNHVT